MIDLPSSPHKGHNPWYFYDLRNSLIQFPRLLSLNQCMNTCIHYYTSLRDNLWNYLGQLMCFLCYWLIIYSCYLILNLLLLKLLYILYWFFLFGGLGRLPCYLHSSLHNCGCSCYFDCARWPNQLSMGILWGILWVCFPADSKQWLIKLTLITYWSGARHYHDIAKTGLVSFCIMWLSGILYHVADRMISPWGSIIK